MTEHKKIHEANRASWNAATVAHNSHKGDQAAFFREGGSSLFPEEIELLGDVAGLDVLHLQCNAGQDTLSLARLGARVTGVDISDEAIAFARKLSAESGIDATFVRADVYDWFTGARERGLAYDAIFASYGVLCWLTDLDAWGEGIASLLKPGGRFAMIEFHPFMMTLDDKWAVAYDYFSHEPIHEEAGVLDYVASSGDNLIAGEGSQGVEDFQNPHPTFEFLWGVGDVVMALVNAGLSVERLTEYPYINGWTAWFDDLEDIGGRRMMRADGKPRGPMMLGVVARKK